MADLAAPGPEFLKSTDSILPSNEIEILSESDPEVRKEVIAKASKASTGNDTVGLGLSPLRFSSGFYQWFLFYSA